MKERPILFSAPMVRALLDGSKTQTRRVSGLEVINAEPDRYEFRGITSGPGVPHFAFHDRKSGAQVLVKCKQGQPGDRLWVRETWQGPLLTEGDEFEAYRENPDDFRTPAYCQYAADGGTKPEFMTDDDELVRRWRPSIFMPRWASRITLEITAMRVERLQDISRGDAMDEGCPFPNMAKVDDPRKWYTNLWDSINGPSSWDANPWVWVIEFKKVTP